MIDLSDRDLAILRMALKEHQLTTEGEYWFAIQELYDKIMNECARREEAK